MPTEDLDGQEEARATRHPARAIQRQASCRKDTVQVGMMVKLLAPRVEDGETAKFGTEMPRVSADILEGACYGLKEQAIEHARVLEHKRTEGMGQGKDDMHRGHIEYLALSCRQPLRLGRSVAFWAVPIPARIIAALLVAEVVALRRMAAEEGRATGRNIPERTLLRAGEGGAIACQEGIAMLAYHVSHFQHGARHDRISNAVGSSKVSRGLAVSWAAIGETWRYRLVERRLASPKRS